MVASLAQPRLLVVDPADDLDVVLRRTCPSDPAVLIAALERMLFRALIRRGETWHLRTCMDARVNSRPYGCSAPCVETQTVLAWAGISRARAAIGRPTR